MNPTGPISHHMSAPFVLTLALSGYAPSYFFSSGNELRIILHYSVSPAVFQVSECLGSRMERNLGSPGLHMSEPGQDVRRKSQGTSWVVREPGACWAQVGGRGMGPCELQLVWV